MKTKPMTIVLLLSAMLLIMSTACYSANNEKKSLSDAIAATQQIRLPGDGEVCTVSFKALAKDTSQKSGFGIATVIDGKARSIASWNYSNGKWQFT